MEPAGNTTHRLGRYHLSEPVGGGPTGEVFRAKVHGVAGFEREFALKKFHPQLLSDGASLGKLRAGARLYAGLEHPRIARLLEHSLEAPAFAAVEWVPGIDLARLIAATFGQGRPLPAGAATALLSRAARAVGYAHGRGQSHLGLCPTNIICTPAGDIKVTDFGLLAARLSERPSEDETLTRRLPYLAPEQMTGASTSPATDVFSLGSVFYELLSGERAFRGSVGRDIAAAVLAAAPDTDAIPKPLARVLDRCFAQSPFERYPGGGALADAVDAAGRGMLMRGDERDVAKAVQEACERIESMRQEQVSGVFSFPMPRPPASSASGSSSAAMSMQRSLAVPNLELDERVEDDATTDVLPAGTPLPPAADPAAQAHRAPPSATVPALPPPVTPHKRTEVSTSSPLPPLPVGSAAPANPHAPPSPSRFGPPPSSRGLSVEPPPTPAAPKPPPTTASAGPPAFKPPGPAAPGAIAPQPPPPLPDGFIDNLPTEENHATVPFDRAEPIELPANPPPRVRALETVDGSPAPQTPLPMRPPSQIGDGLLASQGSGLGRKAMLALGLASLGAIGFFGYLILFGDSKSAVGGGGGDGSGTGSAVALATPDGGARGSPDASTVATVATVDGGRVVATATPDAGSRPDATAVVAGVDAGDASGDTSGGDPGPTLELSVTSKPRRALVYLDGTKIGKTPVKVEIGGDKHKLVLIRPGHKLHIAEIKGGGDVHVDLEPVTPSGGPAGIKVRCRNKNRYYAFIDGKETGQLCPTERVEVELGTHTVEVYDPVTDSRRRWDIEVVQTRRSHRVRVDF